MIRLTDEEVENVRMANTGRELASGLYQIDVVLYGISSAEFTHRLMWELHDAPLIFKIGHKPDDKYKDKFDDGLSVPQRRNVLDRLDSYEDCVFNFVTV